jgi:hypothetical protein
MSPHKAARVQAICRILRTNAKTGKLSDTKSLPVDTIFQIGKNRLYRGEVRGYVAVRKDGGTNE